MRTAVPNQLRQSEEGDYRERQAPIKKKRICKWKNCKTKLNSFHRNVYCYIHEAQAYMQYVQGRYRNSVHYDVNIRRWDK